MKKIVLITAAFLMLLPLSVLAQRDEYLPLRMGSISFRIGGFFPSGSSDIWDFNTEDFILAVEDFNSYMIGCEFNWFASRLITLGFAIDYYKKTVGTEYRDYVYEDGSSIFQDLSLEIIPLTVTAKLTPLGNGSPSYGGRSGAPIVPWVGGGVGIYAFRYEEFGEFIDFSDFTIFEGDFLTESAAFGFHVAGGVVVPLGIDWDVFGEARYAVVKGDLSEDFLGYDPIDIGGLSAIFGFSYRF